MSTKKLSSLATIFLLLFGLVPLSAYAETSFTGGSDVSGGINVATAITDLQVSGPGESDNVPVFLFVSAGSLTMTTTTGLTFTGATSGQRLYFSGTLANVNAALATLQYTHSSAGTFTLEASIIGAGQIYDPASQHIYEVVNNGSSISASSARTAALARNINGVSGYLANITSQQENNFISARLTQDGWFGASDAAVEGDWVWLDGPEAGTLFWRGTGQFATGFGYNNWSNGEPNQSGEEDCSQFYANGSGWNDLPCSGGNLSYYVVEYGAPENLPSTASDSLTITLSADIIPPTITSITSDKANGAYTVGEVIDIDIIFSETITSTGDVTVTLETGDTDRTCTFDISSSTVGTCNYTVQEGDNTDDLTVLSVAGVIKDGAGNAMIEFEPVTNLAENKDIVVDTIPPVISMLEYGIFRPAGLSVRWVTDEPATSRVLYNNVAPDSLVNNSTNVTLTTVHVSSILGLDEKTEYSFYVTSTDAAGNTSSSESTIANTAHQGGGVGTPTVMDIETPPIEKPFEEKNSPEKIEINVEKTVQNILEISEVDIPIDVDIVEDNSTEIICTIHPYLKSPIKLGRKNNSAEVKLLEEFLNRYEDAQLPVDGFYSREDFYAVVKWQEKYTESILSPWKLKKGTGFVYTTSLAKIKEIEEGRCSMGK